jgi:hypothetical protein
MVNSQRKGVGKLLFEYMLATEGGDSPYNPARIAYDRSVTLRIPLRSQ